MGKIYKGDQYKGLNLNPSNKCSDGFITKMLEAFHQRCLHAVETMHKPRGFHLVLTKVDKSKVREIPRIISRWVKRRSECELSFITGKYHFIKAIEIRPRTQEFHIHLHLIIDGVTYNDIQSLREALLLVARESTLKQRGLRYRPIEININTGECSVDGNTGNFRRDGAAWQHDLKKEFEDYFERGSYICKVKTKISLNSWSCSRIAESPPEFSKIKYHDLASPIKITNKITNNFSCNQILTTRSQFLASDKCNAEAVT